MGRRGVADGVETCTRENEMICRFAKKERLHNVENLRGANPPSLEWYARVFQFCAKNSFP